MIELGQLPYVRIPNNKYKRSEENRKLPLEFHSNNFCRSDPINAKISGQNFKANAIVAHP